MAVIKTGSSPRAWGTGTIQYIELAFFDVEHRKALLDGYGAQWRQQVGHGSLQQPMG
jgi:hypothetical protein